MKITIIGISKTTDYIIDKIINHSDDISVYSNNRDFNFENKNLNNNIEIFSGIDLEENIEKISESSDIVFLLSESDPFNSFSYQKIINFNPNKKIVMLISDKEIFDMYKEKNYSVISPFGIDENDFSYLIKE